MPQNYKMRVPLSWLKLSCLYVSSSDVRSLLLVALTSKHFPGSLQVSPKERRKINRLWWGQWLQSAAPQLQQSLQQQGQRFP